MGMKIPSLLSFTVCSQKALESSPPIPYGAGIVERPCEPVQLAKRKRDGRPSLSSAWKWRLGLIFFVVFLLAGCPPPPPPVATLTEFQPGYGRGGRSVAVSINPANSQIALAAGESGGLFKTTDGGQTWSHVDSFSPFRMSNVEFVSAGFANEQIVLATAIGDANPSPQLNQGGLWASNDAGAIWTHVIPTANCFSSPTSAYGIAFLAPSSVFVATDCGLLANTSVGVGNWADASNWNLIQPRGDLSGLMSVAAQGSATVVILDVCFQGGGHARSINNGITWSAVHSGPDCPSSHSIAVSPLELNVVFGTSGGFVIESDDAGATWLNLQNGSFSTRPKFVSTHISADQNQSHFDLYFSGRQVTCATPGSTGQRCPTETKANPWKFLPTSSLNHDINGIAFDPGSSNCAIYEAADFGLFKAGAPIEGNPCGDPGAWTIAGNAGAGFGALQLYQLAGQAAGTHTSLFAGTMDNGILGTFDAFSPTWSCFGANGDCDPEGSHIQVAPPSQSSTQITADSLDLGAMVKVSLNQSNGSFSSESTWTSINPPGNSSPPFLISPNTYVAWAINDDPTAISGSPGAQNNALTSWISASDSLQHIAYIASNGHVIELYRHIGQQPWALNDVTSIARGAPLAQSGALTSWVSSTDNLQHIAYIGRDGRIYELYLTVGAGGANWAFDNPTSISSSPFAQPGALTSWVSSTDNLQHIAYIGKDSRIYELYMHVGVQPWAFDNPTSISSSPFAQPGALTSWVSSTDNLQHIAYIGKDSRIYELYMHVGVQPWAFDNPTSISSSPFAQPGTLTSWVSSTDNLQHIVYIGKDSHIYELYMHFGVQPWAFDDLNAATGAFAPQNGALTSWVANTDSPKHVAYIAANGDVYELFSGYTLLITQDGGSSWRPIGLLRPNLEPRDSIQVTTSPQGPVLFEIVFDPNRNFTGLALLPHLSPVASLPKLFEIQSLYGKNTRGSFSGLDNVWGFSFGQGAFYCQPVYAVDPNDFRHLFAADDIQQFVATSFDAGETWKKDIGLTNLVTTGAGSFTDSLGQSQVHAIAFDPSNSSHILVGTDQAGIFASANGGVTWQALPNTTQARVITSFFFDDRTNSIFVGTYGRGLWKLALDWSTVR
jgi:hypothetical protein